MARNRAVELSLGEVARLCLLSASLVILILVNMSQVSDGQVSSSSAANSTTGGLEQNLYGSCGLAVNGSGGCNEEMANSGEPWVLDELVGRGQYPFHVGIYDGDVYGCGGVLLDSFRVLTAAACTRSQVHKLQIKVGDLDISQSDGEQTYAVQHVELSPNSRLAILFTKKTIRIGIQLPGGLNPVWPINLPKLHHIPRGKFIITGWGQEKIGGQVSNHLRKRVISTSDCRRPLEGRFCSRQLPANFPGLCGGYIGGPVFRLVNGAFATPELVGIYHGYSRDMTCQDSNDDYEFSDIWPHVDWLWAAALPKGFNNKPLSNLI